MHCNRNQDILFVMHWSANKLLLVWDYKIYPLSPDNNIRYWVSEKQNFMHHSERQTSARWYTLCAHNAAELKYEINKALEIFLPLFPVMQNLPAAKTTRIANTIHCFAMFSKKFTVRCSVRCIVSNLWEASYERGRTPHIFIAKICAILHCIVIVNMCFLLWTAGVHWVHG